MANNLRWTEEQLASVLKRDKPKTGRVRGTKRQRDPVTGKTVDSKREMDRLHELRSLFRAGEMDLLATQAWIRIEGGRYELDFLYGRFVDIDGVLHLKFTAEDAKGWATDVYKRKRAQMRERYGLEIVES